MSAIRDDALKMGVRELDLVTQYTVHPYDEVLGLYFAQARMYDAGDRRFAAADPVKGTAANALTLVQYTYVLDNPLVWVDPLGLLANNAGITYHSRLSGSGDSYEAPPEPQPQPPPDAMAPPPSSGAVEIIVNGTKITDTMIIDGRAWGNARQIAQKLGIGFNSRNYDTYLTDSGVTICSVRDLAKAADVEDCMSWWKDSFGLHVIIQTAQKDSPVRIIREGNAISITGHVVFAESYNDIEPTTKMNYAYHALDGIEYFWSSSRNGESYTINGQTVTVETDLNNITHNPSSHSYFTVNIREMDRLKHSLGNATANNWSVTSDKAINLYQKYYVRTDTVWGAGMIDIFEPFPVDHFRRIAAHEFGHILGIDDAYGDDNDPNGRPEASSYNGGLGIVIFDDMMRSQYNDPSPLSGWDLAMAQQAVTENNWQFWGNYYSNIQSVIIGSYSASQ